MGTLLLQNFIFVLHIVNSFLLYQQISTELHTHLCLSLS